MTEASEVLTQMVRPWEKPVAYLSKILDSVSKEWLLCLQVIVTALLTKEAHKLT